MDGPFGIRMEATAHTRRWLLRILLVALAVRVVAAIGLDQFLASREPPRSFLIEGDAEGYWDLAGDLAAGREYAVYTPPRRVLRMPGFPAMLAIPRAAFGDSLLAARLWLAIIGTLACWGVWRLGADLVDETTGLIAAAIAALAPVMVGFTPIILSETTFAAAMLASLITAARLLRAHTNSDSPSNADPIAQGAPLKWPVLKWPVLSGLGVAAATCVRPSWLLIAPLLAIALALLSRHRFRALRDGCIVCGVVLIALLPWAWRNYQATGQFVLTTLWMGPSLYDGLNPEATGDSNMAFFDRDNLLGRGMSEYDVNRHYRDAAWEFARENPGRALQLAVAKFLRYSKPWPNAEQFQSRWARIAVALSFVPVLVFAAVGAWQQRSDRPLLLLTLGPILYFCALHLIFVSSLRYRLPAEYPLLVLSAVGLRACLPDRWLACCGDGGGVPSHAGGTAS